ncbi:MAG: cytochrome P450 [Stenotrophobium sp.]
MNSVISGATVDSPAVRSMDTLPRPPYHSLLGFVSYWAAPEFARKHFEKLGERVVVKVPLLPTLLVTSSPADCRAIFTDHSGAIRFGEALRRMAPHEAIFGTEMIEWWNGANHALLRQKVMPAFGAKALAGYEATIIEAAEKRIAQWPVDKPVRFTSLMRKLARDVIIAVVFGVTDAGRRERLEQAFIELDQMLASPGMISRYFFAMTRRGKWPSFRKLDAINARIDAITLEEVAFRRTNPSTGERKDCLELFLQLQATDQDNLLSDKMLAVFQRLLLIAGHETTAVTLSWVAERLVRHPEILDKLEASLARGEDDYMDAVVTEVMRLRPALPVTLRYAEKDFMMNDVLVPAGTIIVIYINGAHKRADIYPEPERFMPERFLGVRPDPYKWLPFGGGAHRCLGDRFAMFEARVLMRTILKHRRFKPDDSPGEREDQHRNILLLPHNGATVTLLRR